MSRSSVPFHPTHPNLSKEKRERRVWNKSIFCCTWQPHDLVLIYLQFSQLALVVPKFNPWKALENGDVHPMGWGEEVVNL